MYPGRRPSDQGGRCMRPGKLTSWPSATSPFDDHDDIPPPAAGFVGTIGSTLQRIYRTLRLFSSMRRRGASGPSVPASEATHNRAGTPGDRRPHRTSHAGNCSRGRQRRRAQFLQLRNIRDYARAPRAQAPRTTATLKRALSTSKNFHWADGRFDRCATRSNI